MADVYRDDESKYLKALTAEYPQIVFSKVIKSTSMESSDLFKSQKDLEETLVSLTRKGESTKWSFRSFKEVKEQLEKKKLEEKNSSKKRKEVVFERQERNLSLGSARYKTISNGEKCRRLDRATNNTTSQQKNSLTEDDVVDYINECRATIFKDEDFSE
ncbi:unnamed protein product [Rhizophagus irregularis]|nr:unnamed protein product [Rhizophagus irregularis]